MRRHQETWVIQAVGTHAYHEQHRAVARFHLDPWKEVIRRERRAAWLRLVRVVSLLALALLGGTILMLCTRGA